MSNLMSGLETTFWNGILPHMEYHKRRFQTLDDLLQIWLHFCQPSSSRLLLEFQEASEKKQVARKLTISRKLFRHD